MTVRESRLTSNIEAMAEYCCRAGTLPAPHGKTTMSPQFSSRKIAAGA